jgi:hypothetical protein
VGDEKGETKSDGGEIIGEGGEVLCPSLVPPLPRNYQDCTNYMYHGE